MCNEGMRKGGKIRVRKEKKRGEGRVKKKGRGCLFDLSRKQS